MGNTNMENGHMGNGISKTDNGICRKYMLEICAALYFSLLLIILGSK